MISDYSVSVIALNKDNRKYGMTCAWFMPVDYDKLLCLLGAQSKTGHIIKKGDIILFRRNHNKYVLHRITQRMAGGFVTTGDGNLYRDGFVSNDEICFCQVFECFLLLNTLFK